MKPVVHGRQPGSKNYTKEFREAVAAEANDPNRSIAEVACAHGLNANMVAQWRRSLLDTQPAPSVPNIALLPVDVVDLPAKDIPHHALPQTPDVSASPAMPPGCEIEIEVGKRRIRIRGVSRGVRRTVFSRLSEVIPPNTRIWIAAGVTDMRSGFNSLAAGGLAHSDSFLRFLRFIEDYRGTRRGS